MSWKQVPGPPSAGWGPAACPAGTGTTGGDAGGRKDVSRDTRTQRGLPAVPHLSPLGDPAQKSEHRAAWRRSSWVRRKGRPAPSRDQWPRRLAVGLQGGLLTSMLSRCLVERMPGSGDTSWPSVPRPHTILDCYGERTWPSTWCQPQMAATSIFRESDAARGQTKAQAQ